MLDPDIQVGCYVTAIICGTDCENKEGLVTRINGDVIAVKNAEGTNVCYRKYAARTVIPESAKEFLVQELIRSIKD